MERPQYPSCLDAIATIVGLGPIVSLVGPARAYAPHATVGPVAIRFASTRARGQTHPRVAAASCDGQRTVWPIAERSKSAAAEA